MSSISTSTRNKSILTGGSSISKKRIKSNHYLNEVKPRQTHSKKQVIIQWTLMKYLLPAMLKGRVDVFSPQKNITSVKQKLIQGGSMACVIQIRLGDPKRPSCLRKNHDESSESS